MLNRDVMGFFTSKIEVKSSKSVCRGIFLLNLCLSILFFTFERCVNDSKIFLPSFKAVQHFWRDFFKRVTDDVDRRKTFFLASCGEYSSFRQDPLEAILVLFGRRALIFCLKALGKIWNITPLFTTNHRTTFLSYYSLLFLCIHTLARLPYYICTLVKSYILLAPVHVGSVLFRFDSRWKIRRLSWKECHFYK